MALSGQSDQTVMFELEPLRLDDNTEVKVPFSYKDFDDDNLTGLVKEDKFLVEYNRLITWYRDLPEGMFISRILRDYASSEPDLEGVRQMCFEALKAYDDFPFGIQAELKKRMETRKGDKLPVKLATDIHRLVSVMEGEEYSVMKELLSNGKPRPSQLQTPLKTPFKKTSEAVGSGSAIELGLIKDTVSTLQADVLHIKQTMHSADKLRAEQMKTMRQSVDSIKCDLVQCGKHITNCVTDMKSQTLSVLQDILKPIESTILAMTDRITKLENFLDTSGIITVEKLVTTDYHASTVTMETHMPEYENDVTTPHHDAQLNGTGGISMSRAIEFENDSGCVIQQVRPISAVNTSVTSDAQTTGTDDLSTARVTGLDNSAAYAEQVIRPIPVIITSCRDDGFKTSTRRKTRRFFVGGYTESTSIQEIYSFVNSKGPSVTNVRIFPVKRSKNKVIIRLNVENDDKANHVLHEKFWPRGIICRPWLSRDAMLRQTRDKRGSRRFTVSRDVPPRMRRNKDADNYSSVNSYELLQEDYASVDVD